MIGLLIYLALRVYAGDRWWWLAFMNNFAPYYFLPLVPIFGVALIFRKWHMVVRLSPVLIIGLVWFAPRWLPKNLALANDKQDVTVVTFNVLPFNNQLDEVVNWLHASDTDIVLLQELDEQSADYLINGLGDAYLHDTLPGNQLTFSHYPIISAETIELAGWWARRLVLGINGQEIAIYNIHLALPTQDNAHFYVPINSGFVQLALKYNPTWRDIQVGILLEVLAEENLPYIVAGDFNMSDQTIIYNQLAAAMNDAFLEAGIGLGATWPTSVATGLPDFMPALVRIDYVWHSHEIVALSAAVGPRLGSDHLPLSAHLRINPST